MNTIQQVETSRLNYLHSNSFFYEYPEDNCFETVDNNHETKTQYIDYKPQLIKYFIDDIEVSASAYYDYKPF